MIAFLIRDGLEEDIATCLHLDHTYETDLVWQMHIFQDEKKAWHIDFKPERLPRTLEGEYASDAARLHHGLPTAQCFLVATRRGDPEILGYLKMQPDPLRRFGLIEDVVVSRPYRRRGIGARLVNIARQWAKEHDLTRLMVATQTKNYPAIQFCQSLNFAFCGFNDRYFPNQDIAVFFSQSLR